MKFAVIFTLLSSLGIIAHAQETLSSPTHVSSPLPTKITPVAPPIALTTLVTSDQPQPEFDKHGNPKLDRKGNPKTKYVKVSRAVTRMLLAHTAKVVDARNVNYLQRTDYQYQYNYVSPACLNTWWCHLLVGDPTAEAVARPVYSDYTTFTFEDAGTGDIYIAGEAGSHLLSFAINSRVQYAFDSGNLVVVDNQGATHQIGLIQKILKPTGQQ